MIQKETRLVVADNSGAKIVACIHIVGSTRKRFAYAGDVIKCAVKKAIPGGDVKPGQVIGATDKKASAPTADPVSVEDVLCSVFGQLGIDTTKTYHTPLGRPVPIVDGGKVIPGLV